jgi:hemoglobin
MRPRSQLLEALGGEEGCRRLSAAFYARVGKDPILRPFFPGKSLRCATEEFGAFLIQFLGGDENETQHRWWLSLRESHARFQIGPDARRAWLKQMTATLDAAPLDDATRNALRHFFSHSSAYVIGRDAAETDHEELAARWNEQGLLDSVIAAVMEGRDDEALALAPRFASRPSVFVGLLARMVQTGRARLIRFVVEAVESDSSLATRRFGNHSLPFRGWRRLPGNGGITTAAWCEPKHPGSGRPYAALFRGERMRVRDGRRDSSCAGPGRCGRERVWRRNARNSTSYGGPAGTYRNCTSLARFRSGSECAGPQR